MSIPLDTNFLIVDDYPSIRMMLKNQLMAIGFSGELYEADGVSMAMELLEKQKEGAGKVGFVISDWKMPGENGLDFVKKVRSSSDFDQLPFLILSTENEQSIVIDTIQAGATNYLLKPWTQQDLMDKIEKCWSKHFS